MTHRCRCYLAHDHTRTCIAILAKITLQSIQIWWPLVSRCTRLIAIWWRLLLIPATSQRIVPRTSIPSNRKNTTSFQTRQSDLRLPNYPDIRPAGANPGSASISAPPDSKYRMLRPKYGTLHTASFVVYHFFAGSINCFNVMLSVRIPSCHHFRYRNSSNLEGPVATALLAEAV
jgi:hypothetical protein